MSSDRVDHLVYRSSRCARSTTCSSSASPTRGRSSRATRPAAPEWSGPWAASGEWAASPNVAQLGGKPPADGSFWMPFDSLVRTFNKVHVCRLPVVTHTERRVAGEWAKATAGGMLSSWPGSQWRTNPSVPDHRRPEDDGAPLALAGARFCAILAQFCAIILTLLSSRSRSPTRRWTPTRGRTSTSTRSASSSTAARSPPRRGRSCRSGARGRARRRVRLACTRQVCREVELSPTLCTTCCRARSTRTSTCRTSSPS